MFAGKIHAMLFRKWKNRVKGRDWYDFAWYASYHPILNLNHLEERMRQSGDYTDIAHLSKTRLMDFIEKAIVDVDMDQARKEVTPFVPDPKVLDI